MSIFATRARLATKDYLDVVQSLVRSNADTASIAASVQQFIDLHLVLCDAS